MFDLFIIWQLIFNISLIDSNKLKTINDLTISSVMKDAFFPWLIIILLSPAIYHIIKILHQSKTIYFVITEQYTKKKSDNRNIDLK